MSRLKAAVDYIAEVAGWSAPQADTKGQYFFALDGGLSVTLMSPDGMTCIMKSTMAALPQDERDAHGMLVLCARRALGHARSSQSIVTVEGNLAILYDSMRLENTELDVVALRLRDFLNDLAWWKESLAPHKAQSSAMPSGTGQESSPKGMFVPGAGWITL